MPRVLVAEDSVTARELLLEILRSDPEITVVGEASDGIAAVEMARTLRPDVVTMDIRMPRLDGFESTRRIMAEAPTPIVIVSSVYDERDVEVSMQALQAGALAVLPKPSGPGSPDFDDQRRRLIDTVKAMAEVKVVRRWPERAPSTPSSVPRGARAVRGQIVAMVASTGGPAALARVLGGLSSDFDTPILVVQHIATGFVGGLAAWLNTTTSLSVRVAEDGESLQPRTVYLAPDGAHLGVSTQTTIALRRTPAIDGFRPSGTALFTSVAEVFGKSVVAVLLTGMGEDGAAGLRDVRAAGGRVIAQDEATSVVFGMPGAAVAAGVVDVTLPLDQIATCVEELTLP